MPVVDYGSWNQIQVAINFSIVILTFNLGHGFIRFASSYNEADKFKTFSTVLLFQVGVVLFIAALFLPFYKAVTFFLIDKNSLLVYLLIALVSVLAISISNIQNYLLVRRMEFRMLVYGLFLLVSDVLLTVCGTLISHDVIGALIGYASSKIFCFFVFSINSHISYHHCSFQLGNLKKLLVFSLPLIFISISYWTIISCSRYFIKYYLGLDSVGLFSVANRLPMMIAIIFSLLSTVFLSNVSRLFDSGSYERVGFWFSHVMRAFFLLGISGGVFLVIANKPFTLIVANSDYLFPDITLVYLFVSLGSLFFGGIQIVSRLYDLEKQVFKNSFNWIVAMLISVVSSVLLIPKLGLLGAAFALFSSFGVSFTLSLMLRPRRIDLNVPWGRLLVYAVFSFCAAYCFAVYIENSSCKSIWIGLLAVLIGVFILVLGLLLKIVDYREFLELMRSKR